MRIMVTSDEGGKPFELFTHEDNGLDEPGWYYMLMCPTTQKYNPETEKYEETNEFQGYEPLEDQPNGPYASLSRAFRDAIECNYDISATEDIRGKAKIA
jgi:hypothetical protein